MTLDVRQSQVPAADPEFEFVRRSRPDAPPPKVSVMITTRNQSNFLEEAVQAVLTQQGVEDLELVVVDDASTDSTPMVMERLLTVSEQPVVFARLRRQVGPGGGRNAAFSLATGPILAFTDSDCIPDPQWLVSLLAAFEDPKVGVVQGRTIGTETRIPLFEHHVESLALDGRYATANAAFRRSAVAGMKFNPACWYWEDIDLAWRVLDQGWQPAYVQEAVVRHRIIPLPALAWILWPRHSAVLPAICRAHPGFRRHLFARVWVSPMNLWFEVGVIGVLLAPWRWVSLVLTLPYAFSFARHRGVAGRFPPAKIAAYVARDLVGLISLLGASLRRRALVL